MVVREVRVRRGGGEGSKSGGRGAEARRGRDRAGRGGRVRREGDARGGG